MQQAGTFLHSDLGQLLHQPQCFLEEKKLLKCLMWMMRARCLAGSDGSSAPVRFVQGYRHTPMLSPTGRADSALGSVSQIKSEASQLSLRPSARATFTQLLLGDTSNSFFFNDKQLKV